jgi:hypothetical protein
LALKNKEKNTPGRSNLLQVIMPKYFISWQKKLLAGQLQVLLQKFCGMEEPAKQAKLQLVALYLKEKESVVSKNEGVLTHPFFLFN